MEKILCWYLIQMRCTHTHAHTRTRTGFVSASLNALPILGKKVLAKRYLTKERHLHEQLVHELLQLFRALLEYVKLFHKSGLRWSTFPFPSLLSSLPPFPSPPFCPNPQDLEPPTPPTHTHLPPTPLSLDCLSLHLFRRLHFCAAWPLPCSCRMNELCHEHIQLTSHDTHAYID